ncbi:MAG: hypothetical protein WB974_10980 [Acidobacteriaceae bacterium]
MNVERHEASGRRPRQIRPKIMTAVFVLVLTLVLFWLVRTMVVHRFYRGGAQEQNQTAP